MSPNTNMALKSKRKKTTKPNIIIIFIFPSFTSHIKKKKFTYTSPTNNELQITRPTKRRLTVHKNGIAMLVAMSVRVESGYI